MFGPLFSGLADETLALATKGPQFILGMYMEEFPDGFPNNGGKALANMFPDGINKPILAVGGLPQKYSGAFHETFDPPIGRLNGLLEPIPTMLLEKYVGMCQKHLKVP